MQDDMMQEFSGTHPALLKELYKERINYQLKAVRRIHNMKTSWPARHL